MTIKLLTKTKLFSAFMIFAIGGGVLFYKNSKGSTNDFNHLPSTLSSKRSFTIDVRSIGELESARSVSIASMIRTEQPKVIEIIADGVNVKKDDLLVRLDAVPFEKKIKDLSSSILENKSQIQAAEHALEWEKEQAAHDAKAVTYELEVAELELDRIIHGDGPLETTRLFAAMQKAKAKFDELNQYALDLSALEEQGFLNPAEVKQAKKKLEEESENYENARKQYESFVQHVHPMQIKKGELAVKRNQTKQEESRRMSQMKITKAHTVVYQAKQQLSSLHRQLQEAKYELSQTDILAPSPGMVVLKDEFRSGQKRKPRIGDTLVRGQAILDLPDMSSMIVKTKVREIDLYKLGVGKPATIEVDAYPNQKFPGVVDFIGVLATTDVLRPTDEKFFELKVVIKQPDTRLRPGMTARVTIHAGKVDQVIAVPIHSVFEIEKKHYCYVAQPTGHYKMQPVEIGMNNEQWVEVLSGLTEYDQICLVLPPEEIVQK